MLRKITLTVVFLVLLLVVARIFGGRGDGAVPATEGTPTADTPAPAARVSVTILSPADGAVEPGPDVMVRLAAEGVTIAPAANHDPGTGHHHIFIDRDPTPLTDTIPSGVSDIRHLGQGQTEFLIEGLAPGPHRFIAVIADWGHVPLNPPAVDTVHFTVAAPPSPER